MPCEGVQLTGVLHTGYLLDTSVFGYHVTPAEYRAGLCNVYFISCHESSPNNYHNRKVKINTFPSAPISHLLVSH